MTSKSKSADANSGKAPRIHWNSKLDEVLIQTLKEEHLTGGRNHDNTWKHDALERVAKAVSDATGMGISVENVRGRRKLLYNSYKVVKECREKSGFGWNSATGLFTADELTWKSLIKDYLQYKQFRSKPVLFYEDLDIIFCKEQVNGLRNFEGGGASSEQSLAGPLHLSIDDQGMDPNEVVSPTTESGSNIQKKGRKRGRSEVEDARIFYKGMVDAAKGLFEAAKEVARALRPPKCDKISEELEKLPGLTDEDMLDAMDLLGTDLQLAEVFFGIKDNLKYTWLRRKLDRIETMILACVAFCFSGI